MSSSLNNIRAHGPFAEDLDTHHRKLDFSASHSSPETRVEQVVEQVELVVVPCRRKLNFSLSGSPSSSSNTSLSASNSSPEITTVLAVVTYRRQLDFVTSDSSLPSSVSSLSSSDSLLSSPDLSTDEKVKRVAMVPETPYSAERISGRKRTASTIEANGIEFSDEDSLSIKRRRRDIFSTVNDIEIDNSPNRTFGQNAEGIKTGDFSFSDDEILSMQRGRTRVTSTPYDTETVNKSEDSFEKTVLDEFVDSIETTVLDEAPDETLVNKSSEILPKTDLDPILREKIDQYFTESNLDKLISESLSPLENFPNYAENYPEIQKELNKWKSQQMEQIPQLIEACTQVHLDQRDEFIETKKREIESTLQFLLFTSMMVSDN